VEAGLGEACFRKEPPGFGEAPVGYQNQNVIAIRRAGALARMKEQVTARSLLEKCIAGEPTLIAVDATAKDLPVGSACNNDAQCGGSMQCQCQLGGGKKCIDPNAVLPYVQFTPQGISPGVRYNLKSTTYGIYIVNNNGEIIGSSGPALALTVVPVAPTSDKYLHFTQDFYLVSSDGKYLERFQRVSSETVNDAPHHACRFNLGLVTAPTQTWRVTQSDSGASPTSYVPFNAPIGVEVGGTGSDPTQPNTSMRRMLTLRSDVNVVVYWWQSDERVAFVPV